MSYTTAELIRLAKTGELSRFSPEELAKYLHIRDNMGMSVLDTALAHDMIASIHPSLLTEKNLLVTGPKNWTAMHWAAQQTLLEFIPKTSLTFKTIMAADTRGWTPMHIMATHGALELVPKNILTEDNLLVEDKDQITPLACATLHGFLDDLLGVELSEKCRDVVGNEWYEKNLKITKHKKDTLTLETDATDIEIF